MIHMSSRRQLVLAVFCTIMFLAPVIYVRYFTSNDSVPVKPNSVTTTTSSDITSLTTTTTELVEPSQTPWRPVRTTTTTTHREGSTATTAAPQPPSTTTTTTTEPPIVCAVGICVDQE